ncbi:hypothetical protein YPPY59_0903, partial [Yersinia pestis PY-59]
MLIIRRPYFS